MANPLIRLLTLGRVGCTKDDAELTSLTAQPRRLMLLVYLALAEPRGFQSRDRLLALFWPEHDERRARNALSQAVHFLRRSLSAGALVNGSDDQLRLHPDAVWCDVVAFEAALAAGRAEEALALYHGPLLDAFHITAAAPELEQWVAAKRERLGRLYQRALRMMAQRHEDAVDFASAAVWHRKLVGVDPLSSCATLDLMRALVAAGEPENALQHARVHETLVREELQATPDPEITSLVQQIRALSVRRPTSAPPKLQKDVLEIPVVRVADVLTDPHPIVAQTVRALRGVEPAKNGMLVRSTSANYLDLRVSLGSVDRALRIMDAFAWACEDRGYEVSVQVGERPALTVVRVDDETVPFHVDEAVDELEYPNGLLGFHIDADWSRLSGNLRRSWREGEQRLEECLGPIIVGFQRAAHAIKTSRKMRLADAEKKRREVIHEELDILRTVNELRTYVALRRIRVCDPSDNLEEWLTWVAQYADLLEHEVLTHPVPGTETLNDTPAPADRDYAADEATSA